MGQVVDSNPFPGFFVSKLYVPLRTPFDPKKQVDMLFGLRQSWLILPCVLLSNLTLMSTLDEQTHGLLIRYSSNSHNLILKP